MHACAHVFEERLQLWLDKHRPFITICTVMLFCKSSNSYKAAKQDIRLNAFFFFFCIKLILGIRSILAFNLDGTGQFRTLIY